MSRIDDEVRKAIAWGRADSESIGYSYDEWVQLVQKLKNRIDILETYIINAGGDIPRNTPKESMKDI